LEAGCVGMPDELAAAIALLEIVGALRLVIQSIFGRRMFLFSWLPVDLRCWRLLSALSSASHEHTTPIVTMFLLAVFVIVGRWPAQFSLH